MATRTEPRADLNAKGTCDQIRPYNIIWAAVYVRTGRRYRRADRSGVRRAKYPRARECGAPGSFPAGRSRDGRHAGYPLPSYRQGDRTMNDHAKQYQQLIAKCWADDAFKQRLLADPVGTLKAEGIRVLAVENTAHVITLVIPEQLKDLSDEAFAGAAGGGWVPVGSGKTVVAYYSGPCTGSCSRPPI